MERKKTCQYCLLKAVMSTGKKNTDQTLRCKAN